MKIRRLVMLPVLFSLLAVILVQCDQLSLYEQFERELRENRAVALAISPISIVLGTGGSVGFSAFGGVAPYAFSIVSGSGTVDPTTGVFTAPLTAGTSTIRVTDDLGCS